MVGKKEKRIFIYIIGTGIILIILGLLIPSPTLAICGPIIIGAGIGYLIKNFRKIVSEKWIESLNKP